MGFEAFVNCFKDGELDGMPRQKVRDAFGPFLTDMGAEKWRVYYDDANWSDVMIEPLAKKDDLLVGIVVDRPCADERLWDSLYQILKLGNIVIYFPSNCPPLVADPEVVKHLPPGMVKSLGEPRCVHSGKEIVEAVRSS
jgi:hypothetical protein